MDKSSDLPRDQSTSWASLFDLEEAERLPDRAWREQELGAVMRHQLASPLQFDLEIPGGLTTEQSQAPGLAEGPPIRSFGDLLFHPHPPIELLEMTKRFAKASHGHRNAIVPKDVALVLYYASLIVALTRCDKRITGLDDRELATGIGWALSRTWIDEPIRQLLAEGLEKINSGTGGRGESSRSDRRDDAET